MANTPVARMADNALRGVALNPSTKDQMKYEAIAECERRGIDLAPTCVLWASKPENKIDPTPTD